MTARGPSVLGLLLVALSTLVFAGPTLAASPQTIYKDLADNGRLDGKYTEADLARAFDLVPVIGSDRPVTRRPAAVNPGSASAERSEPKLPFSGLDLALLTAGGGPLLLIGVGLRRRLATSSHRVVARS
jgi:hypothetical protein